MFKHNIRIPKTLSNSKIIEYFKKYKLDFVLDEINYSTHNDQLSIQKETYKPELNDLYRLHEFLIINKRVTALEFGCGWSSLVIFNALMHNKKKYYKDIKNLRFNNPFELFSVDNEKKFIKISKNRLKKNFRKEYVSAHFRFSEINMNLIDNSICNTYTRLPMVNPDIIYLDGPDQFNVKKKINGINIGHPDFMPMNADIILIEPFLKPGTIIITDGRTSNFRFLTVNLKRKWIFFEDSKNDQHYLYLKEQPLGKPNLNQLKFYKKI